MSKKAVLYLSFLLPLAVAGSAVGQMPGSVSDVNVIEVVQSGQINWTAGTIRTTGMGAAPEEITNPVQAAALAERAAVTVARRNLLEIIKGVRVDSETIVENFITTSDVIKTKISGQIQGAQVVEKRNLTAGGVEVVMEIKLRGAFSDTILPQTPTFPQITEEPGKFVPDKVYTGLVINAKGLNLRPAMAPKIMNEQGEEIYGSAFISRDYAVTQGMVGYSRSMLDAVKNERVADTPVVVRALKSSGNTNTDLIIGNSDALALIAAARNLNFLQQCKVMIVLD
ncbi:MAG: LPP20 family lipoprotein [Candidatus Schekmanbacteria bacterium]|nr:LPP20 family lipoprotein [Candidatus Schekmanbacteria bacterium]